MTHKKVAIVGNGNSSSYAPWFDEFAKDWDIWALPWHPYAYHAQRLFEMHPLELVLESDSGRGGEAYWDKLVELSDMQIPIYMQKAHQGLESGVEYPLDAVVKTLGRDYFGSSPAYPIALAIHESVEHIGIWGVDLRDEDEYHNRPNLEWLLGVAAGEGIKVEVHEDSKLYSIKKDDHIGDIKVTYPTRYGWLA